MILGILAAQIGAGIGEGGGGTGSRYWRMYFTGSTSQVRFMGAGQVDMAESVGGVSVIGAGTPSASSERGSFYEAQDSFNGSTGDHWNSASDLQVPSWLQYDFGLGVEVDINEIAVTGALGSGENLSMFAGALVQSSDDGTTWTTRWVIEPQAVWAESEARTFDSTGGLPALFVCDTQRVNETSATASTTLTGLHFGPERTDRLVAVAIQSTRPTPISAVTIGGVAATLAVRSKDASGGSAFVEIWYARPTGTDGDVVVTQGASETGYTRATVWNIGAVATATPAATARYDTGVSGDMSIAAPTGSVVIAVPCGGVFGDVDLGGLDDTFILTIGTTGYNGFAQEIVATGATKTITATTTAARVAACWSI